jgi:hypothetical protein
MRRHALRKRTEGWGVRIMGGKPGLVRWAHAAEFTAAVVVGAGVAIAVWELTGFDSIFVNFLGISIGSILGVRLKRAAWRRVLPERLHPEIEVAEDSKLEELYLISETNHHREGGRVTLAGGPTEPEGALSPPSASIPPG